MSQLLPPHVQVGQRIILFDGVCKLCHGWARFIIRHDQARHFKLCSVQSAQGRDILEYFGLPVEHFDTMLYVHGSHCYQRSTAFFEVMLALGYPWKLLGIFQYLPLTLRDSLYNAIARRRYRLFGRYEQCLLPTADHRERFLDES